MPELVISNLSKQFNGVQAVDGLNLRVQDGEFFTLLGPSGCGKSTTMAMVAGLEQPDNGSIMVDDAVFTDIAAGKALLPEQRNLGMVFQSYALWPHMSVEANVGVPLRIRKIKGKDSRKRVAEALERVGLGNEGRRYPHELSGGQQQRVALARALVYSPSLLLLDEPLSNLDAKLRDQARAWLKHLQGELGITTIYVTHDQIEALSLSDRIGVMSAGKLLQVGDPQAIYERPTDPEVAAFLGHCNFLPGRIKSCDTDAGYVLVDLGSDVVRVDTTTVGTEGAPVTVGVRSEKLRVDGRNLEAATHEQNRLRMRLVDQSYLGARFEYQLTYGESMLEVEGENRLTDEEVSVFMPPDQCVIFDSTQMDYSN